MIIPAINFLSQLFGQLSIEDSAGAGAPALGSDAGFGFGREWQLESNWPFSLWWWLLIALFALAVIVGLELWPRRNVGSGNEVVVGGTVRGRWWLLLLRCGALALVLWMLGGWQVSRFEIDLPDLVVLLDRSQSMNMPANGGPANDRSASERDTPASEGRGGLGTGAETRWEAAKALISGQADNLVQRLEDDYRLRIATIGETYSALPGSAEAIWGRLDELEAELSVSRLGEAISQAVEGQRGRSTSAIVLISDGYVTEGMSLERAGELAAVERLPVFVIKTGSELPPPNVELVELLADSTVMVGDQVRVLARVRWQIGEADGSVNRRLRVRLIDDESDRVLSDKELTGIAGEGSEQLELLFTATEPGLRRMRVEVDRLPGEIRLDDNLAETSVDVRDESFRVLLIQGAPSYEFRFLKHLLERATNRDGSRQLVELISVLQTGDPRYADQDRAARRLPPVDDETLESLDLIILSDCDPRGLGRVLQSRIVDLVTRKGTSLVVVAGENYLPQALAGTPLESLLPVDPASVTRPAGARQPLGWTLTTLGRSVPSLQIGSSEEPWSGAPPLYWLARAASLRPGARVLLQTESVIGEDASVPIVISQLAGSGQVWLHLTDETFRLRSADFDAELYERYWLQLVRALSQGKQVSGVNEAELEIEGQQFLGGAGVPFEVRLGAQLAATAGGQVQVSVTNSEGKITTFEGVVGAGGRGYRGLIQGLSQGNYRAVLSSPLGPPDPPSDTFTINAKNQELAETKVDLPAIQQLAAMTGGQVLELDEVLRRLPEMLPEGRAVRIRSLEPMIVWNHWLICVLLFGMLCLHWILRRRLGAL